MNKNTNYKGGMPRKLQVYDWLFTILFSLSVVGIVLSVMFSINDKLLAVVILIPLVLATTGYAVIGIKIYEAFTKSLRPINNEATE